MSVLFGWTVVCALSLISFILFYIAFASRELGRFGRFEIFFLMGNIFLLSTLYVIYVSLQGQSLPFANVVFPIFGALLTVYVIINFIVVYRLIASVFEALTQKKFGKFLDTL